VVIRLIMPFMFMFVMVVCFLVMLPRFPLVHTCRVDGAAAVFGVGQGCLLQPLCYLAEGLMLLMGPGLMLESQQIVSR